MAERNAFDGTGATCKTRVEEVQRAAIYPINDQIPIPKGKGALLVVSERHLKNNGSERELKGRGMIKPCNTRYGVRQSFARYCQGYVRDTFIFALQNIPTTEIFHCGTGVLRMFCEGAGTLAESRIKLRGIALLLIEH